MRARPPDDLRRLGGRSAAFVPGAERRDLLPERVLIGEDDDMAVAVFCCFVGAGCHVVGDIHNSCVFTLIIIIIL